MIENHHAERTNNRQGAAIQTAVILMKIMRLILSGLARELYICGRPFFNSSTGRKQRRLYMLRNIFLSWRGDNLRAIKLRKSHLVGAILLGVAIICMANLGEAQVLYGTIVGTVTDATGAVIPDATITATNVLTGQVRTATTSGAGTYVVSTVQAGTYSVQVAKDGFADALITNLPVTVNSQVRADAALKPGKATETVTVTDEAVGLQTETAQVSSQITGKTVSDMPLSGRNVESLFLTVPGMNPPSDNVRNGSVNNPARTMGVDGNGASNTMSDVSIEGISSANSWIGYESSYIPAQDAIETVDVKTGSFNAEQGTAGGTSINMQLKSGTNSYHGTAFENYTGDALDAWPFFSVPSVQKSQPFLIEHQFGGTVGGPILKNKLFGFLSYERLQDHETQTSTSFTVPNDMARQGYFQTPMYNPWTGTVNPKDGAYEGAGRTPFATLAQAPAGAPADNNAWYSINPADQPANMQGYKLDPVDQAYLHSTAGYIPEPTPALMAADLAAGQTYYGGFTNNYLATGAYIYNSNKWDVKVDYNMSEKLHLNYRFSALPFMESVPPAFGLLSGGAPVLSIGQPGITTGNVTSNNLGGVYTFSPHLVLDANVGYTYLKTGVTPPGYGQNIGATLGINNGSGPAIINSGIPQMQYGESNTGGYYSSIKNHNPNHVITANLTWVRGAHNLRFGGNYNKVDLNIAQANFSYDEFSFNGLATSVVGQGSLPHANNGNQEHQFADYLLGLTSDPQKTTLNGNWASLRVPAEDLYAQDQWQVNRKLTVNYGIRWNYYPVPRRDHEGVTIFNVANNEYDVCGRGGLDFNCGVTISKKLFSPLMGLAYRLNDKTVIRAGGGINYEQKQMLGANDSNFLTSYPVNTFFALTNAITYIPVETVSGGPLTVLGGTTPAWIDGYPDLSKAPYWPDMSAAAYPNPPGTSPITLQKGSNFKRGYIESWNFTVERELPKGWSAQAAYVGTQTVHEYYSVNFNQPTSIAESLSSNQVPPYAADCNATTGTCFKNNALNIITPYGHGNYHSLQTQLRHRFQAGYMVTANYTWSKWIVMNGPGTPGYVSKQKALSGEDRPQNFNVSATGESPFGKGKPWLNTGVGAAVLGGWQLNFILSAFSGTPFTVTAQDGLPTFGFGTQFPDKIKAGKVAVNKGNLTNYFDQTFFQTATEVNGAGKTVPITSRFGTAGYTSVEGPGAFNIDAGFGRKFAIWRNVHLSLRADAFNFTNTPHFSNPNSNLTSGTVGHITGVSYYGGRFGLDQRQIRLGAHLDF
jgi:hypothetical protein